MATLTLFNPNDMENNTDNEDGQNLLGLTIKSNCNNELDYIPQPPACEKPEVCKPIECKPLGSIGIELNEINNIRNPIQLGRGGMNIVYDITYNNDLPLALRLTTTDTSDIKKNESVGLLYQTKLSKSIEEGGSGCPYIAKVYDFGDYEGNFKNHTKGVYGILEKLPQDLLDRIMDGSIFTEDDVKIMTKQMLEALSCMHNNNIYHFDIKPDNIMMCDEGNQNIKLIDFGLCYTDNGQKTSNGLLTKIRGTPGARYLSPGYYFRIKGYIEDRPYAIDDLWSVAIVMCLILSPDGFLLTNFFRGTWDVATFTRKSINQDGTYTILINQDGTYTSTTGITYSKQCIDFIEEIFNTVNSDKVPTETFTTLSADDLLNNPWFQEVKETKGGKSRRKRRHKRKTKRRTKSKK
jgi:serine/threonine protein kinase